MTKFRAIVYAAVLFWVNAYVCRTWLFHPTAAMQSSNGYIPAVGRLGGASLEAGWWPFTDCGLPARFASPPLAPALTAAIANWRGIPHAMAFQHVQAAAYCAAPVALFLLAWLLTRAAEYSFFAALLYSLLAPARLLAPEGRLDWSGLFDAYRFRMLAYGDATPRALALALLLFFVFFLARAFERRSAAHCAFAALLLAAAMLADPFASLTATLAAICLAESMPRELRRRNLALAAGIAAAALAIDAAFLPPSLWFAMAATSLANEPWTMGPLTALSAAAAGWLTLVRHLPHWSKDWRIRFFALFAFAASCSPMAISWLHRQWLPRPHAFRIEMEAALALAAVFAIRPWLKRMPGPGTAVAVTAALALAGLQLVNLRRQAKDVLFPADVRKTIEYRTTQRIAQELPGARVAMPPSMARWANLFATVPQLGGGSGTMDWNAAVRVAERAVYEGPPDVAPAWLKAYGAAAVVARSGRFDAVLPALWSEDGITVYRVPTRSMSLARIVPESALARRSDTGDVQHFEAALDSAEFEWRGRNAIRIRGATSPGDVVSIAISQHPGWRARVDGRPAELHRDGLGLMWLRPFAPGPFTAELEYDGGPELRLCRWISAVALLGTLAFAAKRGPR